MLKFMIDGNPKGTPEDEVMLGKRWVKDCWLAMDQSSRNGSNLFHLTAQYSDIEVISYLIDAFERRERILANSEALPAQYCNLELKTMRQVIEVPCQGRYTPLLLAVKQCRVEAAKYLTSQGCNIYVRNERLQNCLHLSSLNGSQELIDFFIRLDSDRNILRGERDIKQRRPRDFDITGKFLEYFSHIWDFAKEGNDVKVRELISRQRFGVNEATPRLKLTPLHYAVESKQLMTIKSLMMLGADPLRRNEEGHSSIDLALDYKDSSFEAVVLKLMRADRNSLKSNYSEEDLNSLIRQVQLKKTYNPQLKLVEHEMLSSKMAKRKEALAEQFAAIKAKLKQQNVSLDELFSMIDKRRGQALTHIEFEGILLWLGVNLTQKGLKRMLKALDSQGKGEVDFNKLHQNITGRVVEEDEVGRPLKNALKSKLLSIIDDLSHRH
jgi:ankyrin repeat protein